MNRFLSSTSASRSAQAKTTRQHVRWAARRNHLLPKALTASPHHNPFTFDDAATPALDSQPSINYAQHFWPVSASAQDFAHRSETFFGHVGGEAASMRCEVCNRPFASLHQLLTHVHTKPAVRPFECKYCQKDFEDVHKLRQHLQFHSGAKPYECDFCGKALSKLSSYKRHVEKHAQLDY